MSNIFGLIGVTIITFVGLAFVFNYTIPILEHPDGNPNGQNMLEKIIYTGQLENVTVHSSIFNHQTTLRFNDGTVYTLEGVPEGLQIGRMYTIYKSPFSDNLAIKEP